MGGRAKRMQCHFPVSFLHAKYTVCIVHVHVNCNTGTCTLQCTCKLYSRISTCT